jgi:VanZ family protein
LVLFAMGTAWVLRRSILRKEHWPLIMGILLTWGITYFSGSSGSAEPMRRSFSFLGLSPEMTEHLVVAVRKLMHVSFYGSMAWFFVTHFQRLDAERGRWAGYLESFIVCCIFASCDEMRQSLMPNREGTLRDVTLDMVAVIVVLGFTYFRTTRRLIDKNSLSAT